MMSVRSWPARPTNGSPWMSSSRPGASPMNIRSAFGLPTPYTTWVLLFDNRHFSQAVTTRSSSARRSCGGQRPSAVQTAVGGCPPPMSRCVYPNSRRSSSSRRRSSVMRQALHDLVENAVRDHDLRCPVDLDPLPVAREYQHLVLIGIEADRWIADVVCDDQINLFLQQLFARVLFHRLGFSRESYDEWTRRRGGDVGEDVGTLVESQSQLVALILLDLLRGGGGRCEIG